jgi:hypothetical protein
MDTEMQLRRATTATDLEQAETLKDLLDTAGVATTLRGGLHDAYPGTSGLGAIDVLVADGDYDRARDVLSRASDGGLDFDLEREE